MIIQLLRSGGFAAIQLHAEIDLNQLGAEERQRLAALVEAANFFALPAELPPTPGADRFQYTLTIQRGEQVHTVQGSEAALPAPLHQLVEEVSGLARRARGAS
jgi:hypothetical protein